MPPVEAAKVLMIDPDFSLEQSFQRHSLIETKAIGSV